METTVQIYFGGSVGVKTYNSSKLKSVSSQTRISGENENPNWGVISSGMSVVELYDIDDEFLNYAQQKILVSDLPIKVFLGNIQLGDYLSEKFHYNENGGVKIELKDTLLKWQDTFFAGISDNNSNNGLATFNALRTATFNASGEYVNLDPNDGGISAYLSNFNFPNGFIASGNLWGAWNTLCQMCLTNVYKNEQGNIVFVRQGTTTATILTEATIKENGLSTDLVVDNEYKGIFGSQTVNMISEVKQLYQQEYQISNNTLSVVSSTSYNNDSLYTRRTDTLTITPNNPNIAINFQRPTYVSRVQVDLEYTRTTFYFLRSGQNNPSVSSIISGMPVDRRNITWQSLGNNWGYDNGGANTANATTTETLVNTDVSNPDRFTFNYTVPNTSKQSGVWGTFLASVSGIGAGNPTGASSGNDSGMAGVPSVYPTKVTVTVFGTEMLTNDIAFKRPTNINTNNALEFGANTLLTTTANYAGTPLVDWLANQIGNQATNQGAWLNGKQTVHVEKIIERETDIVKANNVIKVAHRMTTKADQTLKSFKVISADFQFYGDHEQILDLQEV